MHDLIEIKGSLTKENIMVSWAKLQTRPWKGKKRKEKRSKT